MIFCFGQTSIIAALVYCYSMLPSNPEAQKRLSMTQAQFEPPSAWSALTQTEGTSNDKKMVRMSQLEYDRVIWWRKFQQTMMAISVICCLHYFLGIVVPLVMSVVLNVFGLLDDPLVRIYLRGHSPEYNKALVRPFKLVKLRKELHSLYAHKNRVKNRF